MSRSPLRVGIIGCGLIGHKRADAIGANDVLVGFYDEDVVRAQVLAEEYRSNAFGSVEELLEHQPDVVIVAVRHDSLAGLAEQALDAGGHVLVEKPAGLGVAQIERLMRAEERANRRVKVGFNHRFYPGLQRLAQEVASGAHGELFHVRGRYGHGGRQGYDREWRADPTFSGGGELVDQGMHLIDLCHWIAGPLPFHSALLRTHFWDTSVEDNAAVLLGEVGSRTARWAMLHVTWTEWKNMFSLEVYCRNAKLQVEGLVRSYGPQRLRIYRMRPDLGPPDLEEMLYSEEDQSWSAEWEHFAEVISAADRRLLLGNLDDAHYAWSQAEAAYAQGAYASMRDGVAMRSLG